MVVVVSLLARAWNSRRAASSSSGGLSPTSSGPSPCLPPSSMARTATHRSAAGHGALLVDADGSLPARLPPGAREMEGDGGGGRLDCLPAEHLLADAEDNHGAPPPDVHPSSLCDAGTMLHHAGMALLVGVAQPRGRAPLRPAHLCPLLQLPRAPLLFLLTDPTETRARRLAMSRARLLALLFFLRASGSLSSPRVRPCSPSLHRRRGHASPAARAPPPPCRQDLCGKDGEERFDSITCGSPVSLTVDIELGGPLFGCCCWSGIDLLGQQK